MKMKEAIKLAVLVTLALGATSVFATNGDHLIGLGAKARGMGGIGIGMSHGAESALANPAMITSVKGTEVSFGGTLFMPDVQADMGAGFSSSIADLSMIPEVSLAAKVNDNTYIGIGMWGTAGMGVDYREATAMTANMNMVTNLQLMQFGVPVAYVTNGLSIGITPIMQYGALDVNYDMNENGGRQVGSGVAQNFGYGYTIGIAYKRESITLGAVYKSAINMEYKGQLSSATAPFVSLGIFPATMSDQLEQPVEIGMGISYSFNKQTIAVDYKKIKWGDAQGYKDFGWKDQDVYAIGYELNTLKWAVRVGYNYAEHPIKDTGAMTVAQAQGAWIDSGSTNPNDIYQYFGGNAMNMFNLLGFPATIESHYTLGGTYQLNEQVALDLALAYAPKITTTLATMPDATNDVSTTVTHSQKTISFQFNFIF